MTIANITNTLTSGVRRVTTAQTKAANIVATCQDEAMSLDIDNALIANNTSGTRIEINNSVVKITNRDYALSYGTGNTDTNSQVNVTDSMIHWELTTARKNIRFTKFVRSTIRSVKTSSTGLAFVYTQAGNQAVLDQATFDGIYVHEVSGLPLVFQKCQYKNCGINLLNWEAGDLTIRNVDFGSGNLAGSTYTGADGGSYNTYDAWLGSGNNANRFRFVNCTINLAKIAINLAPAAGTELCYKSFSRNEKYVLDGIPLTAANVQFTPSASSGSSSQSGFDRSVTSNGHLTDGSTESVSTELLVQTTVDSGTTRASGLSDPATIRNFTLRNITWTRRLRRADIMEAISDVTPTIEIGSDTDPVLANHVRDENFTGTYTQAAAITGIAFSYNSGTGNVAVTLTAQRDIQDIYNAWKHWTSQIAQFNISQSKVTMVGGVLVITGTLVIGSGGSLTGVYRDNTGTRVELNIAINEPGARLYIKDNVGVDQYNDIVAGTSIQLYYPPGSTGIWSGVVELYGYTRATFLVSVTGGGVEHTTVVMVPDTTIVELQAVVQTYTKLETTQKLLDWVANYNQTAIGIKAPINASMSSDILSLGTASLTMGGSIGYTGGMIFTGHSSLTGDIQTTGLVTGTVNGTIYSATVIRFEPGIWNPSLYNVTVRFTQTGTYDMRTANIKGTLTLTNTSGQPVIAQPPPLVPVVNTGPSITLDYKSRLTIASADNIGLSSLIMVNGAFVGGSPIAGWMYNQVSRSLDVNSNDTVSVYVHAYGYRPKLITGVGVVPGVEKITMIPEYVDTDLDTVTRDTLAAHFSAGIDAQGSVFLALNMDMSNHSPEDVLNALHYYLVRYGYMAGAGALVSGTVGGFTFKTGGIYLTTDHFYGKIADSVTVLPDTGIYLPLYVEVDPAVIAANPTYKPVKKNSSGLLLSHALWTKLAASFTLSDKTSTADIIREKLAPDLEAIPTGATLAEIRNDLLTVETRLIHSLYGKSV